MSGPTGGHTWAEHIDCEPAVCGFAYIVRVAGIGAGLTFGPKPCPVSSSITGALCLLPDGHPSDSPTRFHRYAYGRRDTYAHSDEWGKHR